MTEPVDTIQEGCVYLPDKGKWYTYRLTNTANLLFNDDNIDCWSIDIRSAKFNGIISEISLRVNTAIELTIPEMKLVLVFEHEIDLKAFILACYRATASRDIQRLATEMSMNAEINELRRSARLIAQHSSGGVAPPKRKTYVQVNIGPDDPAMGGKKRISRVDAMAVGDQSGSAKEPSVVFTGKGRVCTDIGSSTLTTEKFYETDVQLFSDGRLMIPKTPPVDVICGKVLCSRYSGQGSELEADGAVDLENAMKLCVYERDSSSAMNIVVLFASADNTKTFLSALSGVVSVHNIMGFLMDIGWYEPDAEVESQENSSSARRPTRLEVCLPVTVEEASSSESSDNDDSLGESYKSSCKTDSGKISVERIHSHDSQCTSSVDAPNKSRSILRMLSNESYNELDAVDVEAQHRTQPEIVQESRPSRISQSIHKLLGIVRKESDVTHGDNAETTNVMRQNSTAGDEKRESSLVVDTHGSQPRSRFSFLRAMLHPNVSPRGESDMSFGDFGDLKGIKGSRPVPTSLPSGSRTTRAVGDGLGAAVGGVDFEALLVKKSEFSVRTLELQLKDIKPAPTLKLRDEKAMGQNRGSPSSPTASELFREDTDINPLFLSLNGTDLSREKHLEMIIKIIKLPITESISMVQSWSVAGVTGDLPHHWGTFVEQNPVAFSEKVKTCRDGGGFRYRIQRTDSGSPRSSAPLVSLDESGNESISFPRTIPDSFSKRVPSPDSSLDIYSTHNTNGSSRDLLCEEFIHGLSLRYCDITPRGVSILVDSLRQNSTLRTLDLQGNHISRDNAAASLGNMLNFNKFLVELNVQETELGNTGATMVAQALHINASIVKLNLSGNHIGHVGCLMLSLSLEENATLTHLNISRNEIGPQGAKSLSKALYINKTLKYLDLNRQKLKGKIGPDGAKYMARCLRMNNSLKILRMGRNRISFEGSRHIAGMLLVNRGLRILDLAYSKLGVEGAMQLGNALHQNNSLQSLVLANRLLPICYLKGVHDSDYYMRPSRTSLPVDVSYISSRNSASQDSPSVASPQHINGDSQNIEEYMLDDDVYNANSLGTLNCDVAYDCSMKSFDVIDLQVLFASPVEDSGISSMRGTVSSHTNDHNSALHRGTDFAEGQRKSGQNNDSSNSYYSHDNRGSAGSQVSNLSHTTSTGGSVILPLPVGDEEGVLIGQLVKTNNLLKELRLENTFLPIQQLRGRSIVMNSTTPSVYSLDMTSSNIMSSDAIVIGLLIAENPCLRTICLKGNHFAKTEGETWIANAISVNSTLCLDTNLWSAEEMFADGYHQLAALKGVSASGAAIEPQRLDTLSYKLFIVGGGVAYYLDLFSDIYVTVLYASKPALYEHSWVVWSAFIICLPTVMTLCSIIWTTWSRDAVRAIQQMLIVLIQLHPVLHVYESLLMGIETTALLDTKFLEGVYENIPQIVLQTYIMFRVSVDHGGFAISIFLSVLISLFSVSGVLVMLLDRGKVRKITLGPRDRNPWFVRYLAKVLAVLLEGDRCGQTVVGSPRTQEVMKDLISYSCYTYSHFLWAMVFQFTTLSVRVVALTWLLAVVVSYKFVIFLVVFIPRVIIVAMLDPKSRRRSVFRNTLWCSCYCLLTAVWDKDDRFPVASRRAFLVLNILDTIESFGFIAFAGFISTHSNMRPSHGVFVVVSVIVLKIISWLLIVSWVLPVHFSELQGIDSRMTFKERLHCRLFESDSKVFLDGVVTRDPAVVSLPPAPTSPKSSRHIKSWWTSGERSATMELSYMAALIRTQVPYLKSGATFSETTQSETTPVKREISNARERAQPRDWEGMPEAMRRSKGRFTLRGGKGRYSDEDLQRNIQQRHLNLEGSKHKFTGWNRQVQRGSRRHHTKIQSREHNTRVFFPDGDYDPNEASDGIGVPGYIDQWAKVPQNPKGDHGRRVTAGVDFGSYYPSDSGGVLQDTDFSSQANVADKSQYSDATEMYWEENPSIISKDP